MNTEEWNEVIRLVENPVPGRDVSVIRLLIARILRCLPPAISKIRSAVLLLWLRGCYPGLRVGRGVVIGAGTRIRVMNGAILTIGDRTVIEPRCLLVSGGILTIGTDGFVGTGCTIVATSRVEIGSDALIAANVMIRDQDHGMDSSLPYRLQGLVTKAVTIGSNVWLGAHAMILKGVAIGDNVVIAASAVVSRDIPASSIAAGIPARVIKDIR